MESFESEYQEDVYRSEIIVGEIQHILDCVDTMISDRWLSSIEVPIAAEVAMEKLRKLMAWAIIPHDGVVSRSTRQSTDISEKKQVVNPIEKFLPDEIPPPVPMDPWSRGNGK